MAPLKQSLERESQGSCAIKRSKTIRTSKTQGGEAISPNEVWGMFSRKDIKLGQPLFKNSTSFVSCSQCTRCSSCGDTSTTNVIQLSCCSRIFCSKSCMNMVVGLWHGPPECIGPPIDAKVQNPSVRKVNKVKRQQLDQNPDVQADLLQKVLASAYQHTLNKQQHPLTFPLVKNLTIARGANEAVEFSLCKDIVKPIEMLEEMGIDIFQNPDFDSWVVQTIQARLRANTWERDVDGAAYLGLSLLFSLFNHSCIPNVYWGFGEDGTTIELKTLCAIKAGDELYISYLGAEDLDLDLAGRKKKLIHWFPACQCPKCNMEEEGKVRANKRRYQQPQKKRPLHAAWREPIQESIQLLSPEPEYNEEEDIQALMATIIMDDENDLDFDNADFSDDESGYESDTRKSRKRGRR